MTRRWTNMAKNASSNKKKRAKQVALKGRGCRTRTGLYPRRGKGRTAHGRR